MFKRSIPFFLALAALQSLAGCTNPQTSPASPTTPTTPRGLPPQPAVASGTLQAAGQKPDETKTPSSEATKKEPLEGKDKKALDDRSENQEPQGDSEEKPITLKPPPLDPADIPLPINLGAAMQLSDARPLIVAAAQAAALVAEAELAKAKVLWVPSLDLGAAYLRHDGPGPDLINGVPIPPTKQLNQNINFLYAGGGIINQSTQTTDMIFQPLAARQVLNSKKADVQSAKNNVLLQTAEAYYRVHQYRGRYAGALDVVERGTQLVDRIEKLSADLVPRVEVDRARRQLEHLKQEAASALEAYRVASADLTLILRLDPRVVVVPLEHDHLQLTLIDPTKTLDDLIPIGLTYRPELASQQALVQAAMYKIRGEQLRPVLPTLYLNGFQTPHETIQAGVFGIGHDASMNLWDLRDDISPQITFELQNMYLGNRALIATARAQQSQVLIELMKAQDQIAADVTRALARIKSSFARVGQADKALREALITFKGNYEGLRETRRFDKLLVEIYRPQEAVAALEHLKVSYDEFFTTVAEYNRAQFTMFHALGYPAAELSKLHPGGPAAPVNVDRPPYLPAVGEGPPPPTR